MPPTPETNRRPLPTPGTRSPGPVKEVAKLENEDSFDWSSSNDEHLLEAEEAVLSDQARFETPRKAPRTTSLTSPGKGTRGDTMPGFSEPWPLSDDVFATPGTSHMSSGTGLFSPISTPARLPSQLDKDQPTPECSALAIEALSVLKGVHLSAKVEKDLVDLLNKHDLRTQGIVRGRDITRLAVQSKENKIAELQARISTLEGERETNRTVISLLKHDIAASPKKKGRSMPPARRSEV